MYKFKFIRPLHPGNRFTRLGVGLADEIIQQFPDRINKDFLNRRRISCPVPMFRGTGAFFRHIRGKLVELMEKFFTLKALGNVKIDAEGPDNLMVFPPEVNRRGTEYLIIPRIGDVIELIPVMRGTPKHFQAQITPRVADFTVRDISVPYIHNGTAVILG
jgi:hypothetical protein